MKIRSRVLPLAVFFIFSCFAQTESFGADPTKIRGRIVARIWSSHLLVRTDKKEYVIMRLPNFSTNPLPESVLTEKKVWNFAVEPARDCKMPFSFFRFQDFSIGCGNDEPEETIAPQNTRPAPPASYPQLSFIEPKYKKELDAIGDETVPRCFDLDLSRTGAGYTERLVTGIVRYASGQPAPGVEVSVGFSGSTAESYVAMTDADGRFSFSIYKNFAYRVRLRWYSINKENQPIVIPPKTRVEPLALVIDSVLN